MMEPEIILSELFGDNHMEMQSSTIYRALRGEGMRVTPLVSNKVSAESQKVVVPSHMVVSSLKQNTKKTAPRDISAAKTAYVGKIFDLRASTPKDGGSKRPAVDYHPTTTGPPTKVLPNGPTTTKVVMEFKKREVVTPVSASSTQRVPFTSTKLEKQVSRETLKEEESDKKPNAQKKPAANKMSGRRSSLGYKGPTKSRLAVPKARVSSNIPQRLSLYKHRKIKKAATNVADNGRDAQGKVGPEQPNIASKTQPGSAPKERLKTAQRLMPGSAQKLSPGTGSAQKLSPGSAQKLPPGSARKLPLGSKQKLTPRSSQKTLAKCPQPGYESKPGFPSNSESRKSVGGVNITATSRQKAGSLGRKKLWIPTSEAFDSWNQYCPASKVKMQRKQKVIKRRPIEFEEAESVSSRSAGSDFDGDTDDESTEIDEEARRRLRKIEIRREMEQKSVEFFNKFKYGEILRKAIPRIRYNSEIRRDEVSDVRLSDVEIKIRLSRLNDSASRISELMPKWSSMLMTTRETNREEQIRKTLTNAQHILDRKVDRAKEMLAKYIDMSGQAISTEELEDIKRHSELVQLDMNSLERMFAAHEKQLADELEEPTSISP